MPYLDYLDSPAYRKTESRFVPWQKIPTLFTLDIILICASLQLQIPGQPEIFLIGRFVQGISMGGNLTIITMWVQEFAPKELFNQLTIFIIIMLVAGQVTSFLVGTPVSVYEHWPALQKHFTVKGLYYFIVFLMVCLPFFRLAYLWFHREETPMFYLKNGDNKHCRKLISDSYRAERSEEVYKEMRARANGEQSEFFNKIPSQNKKCFGKLKASWIGIYVFILQQFSGINAINFYAVLILRKFFSRVVASWMVIVWGFLDFTCLLMATRYYSDQNKDVYKHFKLFGFITAGFLWLCTQGSYWDWDYLVAFGLVGYIFAYSFSLGPLTWTITNRETPLGCIKYPITFNWIAMLFIGETFPWFTETYGITMSFLVISSVTLIMMIGSFAVLKPKLLF